MSDCSTNWKLPKQRDMEPGVLYMPHEDIDGVTAIDVRGVRFERARECEPIEVYIEPHESNLTATTCSNCRVAVFDLEDCNYCPNCGARVRGGA